MVVGDGTIADLLSGSFSIVTEFVSMQNDEFFYPNTWQVQHFWLTAGASLMWPNLALPGQFSKARFLKVLESIISI